MYTLMLLQISNVDAFITTQDMSLVRLELIPDNMSHYLVLQRYHILLLKITGTHNTHT